MNLAEIPLFSMLRGRLGYLTEQQKVLAQNVANADTARYVPSDLKPFSFDAAVKAVQPAQMMAVTQAGHIAPPSASRGLGSAWKAKKTPDSETTLNGNA